MITDPIADMLTRIRNANALKHEEVVMPSSNLKTQIAKVLKANGFISDYANATVDGKRNLTVKLKYDARGNRVIAGLRRISRPGLRVYSEVDKLPKVINGLGIAIVSTSKGVMTDAEARKARLGGEVLCFVW